MTILALVMAAALVGPPDPADSKRETVRDFAWLGGGATIDLIGTEVGLARIPGVYEMNPLGQTAARRVAFKAAAVTIAALVCRELRKDGHPKAARWVARIGGGAWATAGIINLARAR